MNYRDLVTLRLILNKAKSMPDACCMPEADTERLQELVSRLESVVEYVAPAAAHPEPAPQSEGEREVLIELIQQHLTSMYACGRVWEAWTVGSMSEDDFTPAQETDFAADLADTILGQHQPAPQAEPVMAYRFRTPVDEEGPAWAGTFSDWKVAVRHPPDAVDITPLVALATPQPAPKEQP